MRAYVALRASAFILLLHMLQYSGMKSLEKQNFAARVLSLFG